MSVKFSIIVCPEQIWQRGSLTTPIATKGLVLMFDKVIDKMGPIHQSLSNAYTRRTNEEAVCLAVLFFYVLLWHTNIMTGKGFNLLVNVLPDACICPLRKNSAPFLHEGTVKCIHLTA